MTWTAPHSDGGPTSGLPQIDCTNLYIIFIPICISSMYTYCAWLLLVPSDNKALGLPGVLSFSLGSHKRKPTSNIATSMFQEYA